MYELNDRMKRYEGIESNRRFLPLLPICARIDGKNFSKFTKSLQKPYDERLSSLMIKTTKFLVQKTNALMGYTQSDEITLTWFSDDLKSQIFFDGRVLKMVSVLASMATAFFNHELPTSIPEKRDMLTFFDSRVKQLPTLEEAVNEFLWRETDGTRNSIQMAARSKFSQTDLINKNNKAMMGMLMEKGINWASYPAFFKRGTYIQRCKTKKKFTTIEINKLPPRHDARSNPNLEIERSEIKAIGMPPFSKVTNKIGVIFFGETPTTL